MFVGQSARKLAGPVKLLVRSIRLIWLSQFDSVGFDFSFGADLVGSVWTYCFPVVNHELDDIARISYLTPDLYGSDVD